MENVTNAFRSAQARLVSKAALLMMSGVDDEINTTIYHSIKDFIFKFADIEVKFTSIEPYDEGKVQEALDAMDQMIQQRRDEAKKVYDFLKSVE